MDVSELFRITTDVLDAQALVKLVERPEAGGVTLFYGNVRNFSEGRDVERLEYEAHALPLMESAAALTAAPIDLLPHQVVLTHRIATASPRRYLVADEVGLGKTIEASMVLKEYALRGMAERVLVLTPASLVGQWQEELAVKFGVEFATSYEPALREEPDAFWSRSRIVASMASAFSVEPAARLPPPAFAMTLPIGPKYCSVSATAARRVSLSVTSHAIDL